MRSLILAVSTSAVLLASGCMFLPGYDFDAYLKDGASSSSSSSAAATSDATASSGGGAGGASSVSGSTTATSSVGTGGTGPANPPLYGPMKTGGAINSLVADDNSIYWSTKADPGVKNATVFRASITGGDPVPLLNPPPMLPPIAGLVADANTLYWLQNDDVMNGSKDAHLQKLSKTGGAMSAFIEHIDREGLGLAFSKSTSYITAPDGVFAIDTGNKKRSNCPATPSGPIIVDAFRVYWIDQKGGVLSLPVDRLADMSCSGGHTYGNQDPSGTTGIALGQDNNLYWSQRDGKLYSARADGTSAAGTAYDGNLSEPEALLGVFIDGKIAYLSTPKRLLVFNVETRGAPNTVLTTTNLIVGIAVNGTYVFVADNEAGTKKSSIYRIPKVK